MNKIKTWMSAHPWQVVGFTAWFTAIPIAAASRDDWKQACVWLFLAGIVCWGFSLSRHSTVILALLLGIIPDASAQQPFPPSPDPEQVVPYAVGGALLVGAGIGIYYMYKFCERKFPKTGTNSQLYASPGEDEYGASWTYSHFGSCYTGDFSPSSIENPTTFILNVSILEGGTASTSMSTRSEEEAFQDIDGFKRDMALHGITVDESPGSQSYSRNRIPCNASEVPIIFDPWTMTISNVNGGIPHRVVIERSTNLKDWSPLLATVVDEGSMFNVIDTTPEGQMFYKVTVSEP
jgi:hypothetical protein